MGKTVEEKPREPRGAAGDGAREWHARPVVMQYRFNTVIGYLLPGVPVDEGEWDGGG